MSRRFLPLRPEGPLSSVGTWRSQQENVEDNVSSLLQLNVYKGLNTSIFTVIIIIIVSVMVHMESRAFHHSFILSNNKKHCFN